MGPRFEALVPLITIISSAVFGGGLWLVLWKLTDLDISVAFAIGFIVAIADYFILRFIFAKAMGAGK